MSPCPICRVNVTQRRPENQDFPFCSSRCRTIDLGRWINGDYTIAVQDEAPSEEDIARAEANRERS
jgi:uncharacterized protein